MKSLFLLLGTFNAFAAIGQSWFPIGAQWTYGYGDQLYTGYVTHIATDAVVIDGHLCREIERTRTYGYQWNVYTAELTPYHVYDSAGMVYIHVPGEGFDTLYNMHAEPGDQWMLTPLPEPCDSTSFLEVTDTGHVVMNGVSLGWLAVDLHFPGVWSDPIQDTIVERLGTTHSYLAPQNFCLGAVDGGEGGWLRCYEDAEVDFMRPGLDDCELPLAIEPVHSSDSPGDLLFDRNGVTLSLPSVDRGVVLVYDALGHVVFHRAFRGWVHIGVEDHPPGIYMISWSTDFQASGGARWVLH